LVSSRIRTPPHHRFIDQVRQDTLVRPGVAILHLLNRQLENAPADGLINESGKVPLCAARGQVLAHQPIGFLRDVQVPPGHAFAS
jgi:hypothetical protein